MQTPPGELERAVEKYRQGATDQAIKALEGLSKIKNFPEAAKVQNYLGLAYLDKNDFKNARKAFEKAVDLSPQDAGVRANLALAYLRGNKLNNAQVEAAKAIGINPQLHTAYYVRGLAFLREGKYTEAGDDASRAIGLNADFAPGYDLKAESTVALFGKHVNEGGNARSESALLKKAVETLETCAKNCKTTVADRRNIEEKIESLKTFYDYFQRPDSLLSASTPVPENEQNGLKINAKPRANYTDAARQANISGRIVLAVLLSANGKVTQTIVIKPLGYGLDQEAIRAARQIRFTPAVKDGKPISVVKMIEYSFMIY